jgi:peptidyl-prolyl cis-trans isomerase B (cyclophilin B)
MILMTTSLGPIHIELDHENAPISAANFEALVSDGFYDGLIFHRVIDNFMIQGGGMNADMQEKPAGNPIQNEADNGLKNVRGSLAMARTSDPHSASAQFFINLSDNAFLDHTSKDMQGWGYAVFGKVSEGMDVVDAIRAVATGNKGGHQDVPVETISIVSATVV